ncbi:MAG: helix-turn-helix transcriptional regulator [Prevotella sp.]|nr:helix-turn-helix transcriptional regulator [Prevotella sp.]
MKDRIRQVMEANHMTQQVFATSIGLAPATLSNIYTGRTNPTLTIVEAIKKKIPNINTDWLLFGTGDMYVSSATPVEQPVGLPTPSREPLLDFDTPAAPTPSAAIPVMQKPNSVKSTPQEIVKEEIKIIDKPSRKVVEIRVFYDDQTWESFAPAKK